MKDLDMDFLEKLAREAGEAILEVYGTEFEVESKEDRSPLTLADKRSHEIICRGLLSRYPLIPILSEEGKEVLYGTRQSWTRFWLVDPLDGTKEFVKRNGEFTVNIALVEGSTPVFGLIYIPVSGHLTMGKIGEGCWSVGIGKRDRLQVHTPHPGEPVRVVKSRSHASAKLQALLDLLPSHEIITRGSALKFCTVASGKADFYPRLGPTWEWDTAAGQAIVTAAGGIMVDFQGQPFTCNKPNLLNGPFLIASSLDWLEKTGLLHKAASLTLD